MTNSIAVLISSCDSYADLWHGFMHCWNKNVININQNVFFGTESSNISYPNVENIRTESNSDWSKTFRLQLEKIDATYVLILLEDIYIASNFNFNDILKIIEKNENINYIKLIANLNNENGNIEDLIVTDRFKPYRINVCGLWNKNFLLKMLIDGENPWQFEINGSYRSSFVDYVFETRRPLFQYYNMVEKKIFTLKSYNWALENGIPLNTQGRPKETLAMYYKNFATKFYFNILIRVNWKLRIKIVDFIKKLLISY